MEKQDLQEQNYRMQLQIMELSDKLERLKRKLTEKRRLSRERLHSTK